MPTLPIPVLMKGSKLALVPQHVKNILHVIPITLKKGKWNAPPELVKGFSNSSLLRTISTLNSEESDTDALSQLFSTGCLFQHSYSRWGNLNICLVDATSFKSLGTGLEFLAHWLEECQKQFLKVLTTGSTPGSYTGSSVPVICFLADSIPSDVLALAMNALRVRRLERLLRSEIINDRIQSFTKTIRIFAEAMNADPSGNDSSWAVTDWLEGLIEEADSPPKAWKFRHEADSKWFVGSELPGAIRGSVEASVSFVPLKYSRLIFVFSEKVDVQGIALKCNQSSKEIDEPVATMCEAFLPLPGVTLQDLRKFFSTLMLHLAPAMAKTL